MKFVVDEKEYMSMRKNEEKRFKRQELMTQLPVIGSPAMTKTVRVMAKKTRSAHNISNQKTTKLVKATPWYFDAKETCKVVDLMSPEEQREFNHDIRKLDMRLAGELLTYGTAKFYFNLNLICPTSDLQQIIQLNNIEYGHDLKFISKVYDGMAGKDLQDIFNAVLEPLQY